MIELLITKHGANANEAEQDSGITLLMSAAALGDLILFNEYMSSGCGYY